MGSLCPGTPDNERCLSVVCCIVYAIIRGECVGACFLIRVEADDFLFIFKFKYFGIHLTFNCVLLSPFELKEIPTIS